MRKLQKEKPKEYQRIANLPHSICLAKFDLQQKGIYVFCQVSAPNLPQMKGYQQLFLLNEKGEIIYRDIPRILGAIKTDINTPTSQLPKDYNSVVIGVKKQFDREVKHRQTEKEFHHCLTQGQKYILRELRIFFPSITDEEIKQQIEILERAFRNSVNQAIDRELNKLRRDNFTEGELFPRLKQIYLQHNMHNLPDNNLPTLSQPIPLRICSQAFV